MSKLSYILEDQLAEAKKRAGVKAVRKLYGGLRIEITVVSTDVRLTLVREDQFPSVQEWMTVLNHFPYQVPKTDPEPRQEGGRFTISARIPSERVVQGKFF